MNDSHTTLRPRDVAALTDAIATSTRPLEPIGGGSKRSIGNAVDADRLELAAFNGIVAYSSAELVLTAQAATPLADIQSTLAAQQQRLAFEPPDFGRLLGVDAQPTIGGVLAANLSGSRRVSGGAARDHFLGFEAVSGAGERFRAGGKVVKNVTGYDLPKLLAGSWGTLAVMTEVTVRVAPRPECESTLIIADSSTTEALASMTMALGSALDVSATAFDPWRGTALRLEGFTESVAARESALLELIGSGDVEILATAESRAFWRSYGNAEAFADWPVVWRISVPPSEGSRVVSALEADRYQLDWGGGLIWAAFSSVDTARVRGAFGEGHATLIKAPERLRGRTCIQQPPTAAVRAISDRVKAAFDPAGKLNPGRMD
jgi:glycolate oxidase FAD binding subunit